MDTDRETKFLLTLYWAGQVMRLNAVNLNTALFPRMIKRLMTFFFCILIFLFSIGSFLHLAKKKKTQLLTYTYKRLHAYYKHKRPINSKLQQIILNYLKLKIMRSFKRLSYLNILAPFFFMDGPFIIRLGNTSFKLVNFLYLSYLSLNYSHLISRVLNFAIFAVLKKSWNLILAKYRTREVLNGEI